MPKVSIFTSDTLMRDIIMLKGGGGGGGLGMLYPNSLQGSAGGGGGGGFQRFRTCDYPQLKPLPRN